MSYQDPSFIENISAKDLMEVLELGHKLQSAIKGNRQDDIEHILNDKEKVLDMLAYIMANLDNPNLDQEMFFLILKFFGIDPEKEKEKKRKLDKSKKEDNNLEFDENGELANKAIPKELRAHLFRMLCYEIYKVLNPRQLAGETALDNFINNVMTRGVDVAMQYEGNSYAKEILKESPDALKNLESGKHEFVASLAKRGFHGGGFSR